MPRRDAPDPGDITHGGVTLKGDEVHYGARRIARQISALAAT